MSCLTCLSLLPANTLPFSLDWLPPTACLVGGAVRDALLKRKRHYLDLDFVLPEFAVETALKLANYYHAGFVVLDEARRIARVVFKQGTVDFAQQEGDCLEADLRRRDFTINAIAYNPHTSELIDPLNGLADLEKGILRMVSAANLADDPLRLLRAYRQAAQLNFSIEPDTRATIRQLAPLLAKIAAERVQAELNYLIAMPQGTPWLIAAWEDGLLTPWFKQLSAQKLRQVARVDSAILVIEEMIGDDRFSQVLKTAGNTICAKALPVAKLTSLVSPVYEEAELELTHLKYSRAEVRTALMLLKHLPRLQDSDRPMTLREQYFFFLDLKEIFPILALLAIAANVKPEILLPLIERYLDPTDPVAHPKPLVTGHDLIKQLHLPPSPRIGKLLTEIQIARLEGKIATVEEAIAFARSQV